MKKIVYVTADGGVAIVRPAEGARLALAIKDAKGDDIARSESPVRVETFLRQWPVVGVTSEWAETEDEFLARVKQRDVPVGAPFTYVDEASLPNRAQRAAWVLSGESVVVDAGRLAASRDAQALKLIDGIDRLQFDVMFAQANDIRALRTLVNTLIPNSFAAAQATQVTLAQFRQVLINRWKALNP